MAFRTIKIQEQDRNVTVEQAVTSLKRGELVVFPTETVYGLGVLASHEEAVKRLITAKGRKPGHALPVAISGLSALSRFVPNVDPISERLARRCWPGPLTLVFDTTDPESEFTSLPQVVREAIMPAGSVGFRVPNQPIFLDILKELREPVILTSANLTGMAPATDAEMVCESLEDRVDLFLDDGPAYYGKPSTVLQVLGKKLNIIREGAISRDNIKRLTAKIILFVCTGNTCRSPMAEMLCSKILARNLNCEISDLESNGYLIMSAGLATTPTAGATPEARDVMRTYHLTLDEHESQPMSSTLLQYADLIFVMGRAHRHALLATCPSANDRIFLLSDDGSDINDPLGGSFDVYKECARQIEQELEKRIKLILE